MHLGRVEQRAEVLLAAALEALGGVDDLRAPAVVEGDEQRDPVVVARSAPRPSPSARRSAGVDALAAADEAHPHALLVQLGRLARRSARRTSPSARRPPPAGATSSPSRTSRPSAPRRRARPASRRRALTVSAPARWPSSDRQAARLRPAPVAVGDDRDVARRLAALAPRGPLDLEDLCFFALQQRVELGDLRRR